MNFNFETVDPTLVLIIITKTLDTALNKVSSHLYTKFPRSKNKKSHIQIPLPRNSLDQKTRKKQNFLFLYNIYICTHLYIYTILQILQFSTLKFPKSILSP